MFILENPIYANFFDIIKCSNMGQYLKSFGINEQTKEKIIEIKGGKIKYKIYYINKSYIYNFKEEEVFIPNLKELIQCLIHFNNESKNFSENKKNIDMRQFYLIDKDWIDKLKKRLNFNDNYNKYGQDINILFQEMIISYFNYQSEKEEEIGQVNEDKKIIRYLQYNETQKIIKFYQNYTLINEQIWENITNLFNFHNEIKVKCYFKDDVYIIIYNNKNFEILRFINNNFCDNLLFCFYEEQNIENIIKEIFNSNTSKNFFECINITNTNEIFKKIIDQMERTIEIGIVINIKLAILENNYFRVINKDTFGEESEFEIGLNKSLSETRLGLLKIYKKSLIYKNEDPKFNNSKVNNMNTMTKIVKTKNINKNNLKRKEYYTENNNIIIKLI